MAEVFKGLFGGAPTPPAMIVQPPPAAAPLAPSNDNAEAEEAARKERFAQQQATGRSGTILTDFALAMQQPSTLKKTLGGA